MTKVLLTGATGTVGSELTRRLRRCSSVDLVATSRRGAPEHDVVRWSMEQLPPPPELTKSDFDVIIHAGADTRWNLPPELAHEANVCSTLSALNLAHEQTRFVHLSTAMATGLRGSILSATITDYRNTYEWSKAAAERCVLNHGSHAIVRFPLVVGRRTDGHCDRQTGFHRFVRALASGALPVFVASPSALLELVPVDDVADLIMDLAFSSSGGTYVLGAGEDALSAADAFGLVCDVLNRWRGARGLEPIDEPPAVTPETWERFMLPFARQHLTSRQLRTLQVLDQFRPYLQIDEPLPVTHMSSDTDVAVERTVEAWASAHPRAASVTPKSWKA